MASEMTYTLLPVDFTAGLPVDREVPLAQHGGKLPGNSRVGTQTERLHVRNQSDCEEIVIVESPFLLLCFADEAKKIKPAFPIHQPSIYYSLRNLHG